MTDSFFNVFEFHNFMHDAIDQGLTYEACTITRNVKTESGHELKEGEHFQSIYFYFESAEFHFVRRWVPRTSNPNEGTYIPSDDSFLIPSKELAPFLKW